MKEFRFALKQTFPILLTYLFIGIAFGVLMSEAGYGIVLSALSGIFVYAGSMQIVMVPLLTSGASLTALALMTLLINARHLFYGIGFVEKFRKMGRRCPYMIFSLTDETYSILCSASYDGGLNEDKAAFYIALLNHAYWVLGCILGSCVGQFLPIDLSGIEFSATAFFLVVVVNQWRQYCTKLPFLTALCCAGGFYLLLGAEYFLLPTLLSCLIGLLILRKPIEKKEGSGHV